MVKSCINRVDKDKRSTCSDGLCFSAIICKTIAVEERARPAPNIKEEETSSPNQSDNNPIDYAVIITCAEPKPKTYKRMAFKRSKLSSNPIANNRKITPTSPII